MIPMGFQREKLNNAYQYDNLCALLNLYKSEDLSQFALAAELQKTLSEDTFIGGGKANISVIVENKANGNSNNTFLFLVVPHKCDSKIKIEVYFDDNVLKKIDTGYFDALINIIRMTISTSVWDYTKYVKNLNNKEISIADCLKFLLTTSKKQFEEIPDFLKEKIAGNLGMSFTKVNSALEMLEDEKPITTIIEYIRIENLLPASVLKYAETFMASDLTNNRLNLTVGVDSASVNAYFDYILSFTTFKQDPYKITQIEDKVMYESAELNDLYNTFDIVTESSVNTIKPEALKFIIKNLDEDKTAQILARIYRGLLSDQLLLQNDHGQELVNAFNPDELDVGQMKKILRAAIDDLPANKLKPYEAKAQELLYKAEGGDEATQAAVTKGLETIISSPLLITEIIENEMSILRKQMKEIIMQANA